jgi:predicted transposase YdaD
MKESVVYQEIQATSEARGIAIGRQQGMQEGKQQGMQEGKQEEGIFLILRLLKRRFGDISPDLTSEIRQLSVKQLENLADALLDFQELTDLVNWLNQNNG